MRYVCKDCGSWVKDKFFFGLLHFCSGMPQFQSTVVPENLYRFNSMIQRYHAQGIQASDEEMKEMILTGKTVLELRKEKEGKP